MNSHRATTEAPLWLSDPRIRRLISDSVKRRRAKRKSELVRFETAVRLAEQAGQKPDRRT